MSIADLIIRKKYQDNYRRTHNFNEYYKKYSLKIKARCFAMFGSRCAKRGFADIRALEIDHINGDGAIERKNTRRAGHIMYRAIALGQRTTEDLQLLCCNCNKIKRIENNEHKSKLN